MFSYRTKPLWRRRRNFTRERQADESTAQQLSAQIKARHIVEIVEKLFAETTVMAADLSSPIVFLVFRILTE